MAATHLDVGLRCIKYLLCAVNALFVITGIMIISVGTTIFAVNKDFIRSPYLSHVSPATLLIVAGILVFMIAFLGCCGAVRESTCMVLVFAVSLSIVLVLELAAAITAFTLQNEIKGFVAVNIKHTMQGYGSDNETTDAVDFLQSRLHCCGYNGYQDWQAIMQETGIEFPKSCCRGASFSDDIACSPDSEEIISYPYVTGCISRLTDIVHRSALYIGTGAVAIALIQLTGIMFACMLGKAIRRQKTERERRRWELRESLVNGYQPLGKTDPFITFPVYMTPDASKNP